MSFAAELTLFQRHGISNGMLGPRILIGFLIALLVLTGGFLIVEPSAPLRWTTATVICARYQQSAPIHTDIPVSESVSVFGACGKGPTDAFQN